MSSIQQAATVLLARGPGSDSIYLVKRSEALRFFGGFWAFPGGKVSMGDNEVPTTAPADESERLRIRRAAAARELFEETGVLVARRANGDFFVGPLHELRHDLCAGTKSFAQILNELELSLSPDDFALIGDVTTPEFAPIRFDTSFFVAHAPPGQEPIIVPGELEEGCWLTAAEALARWTRGECLLSPPTIMTLLAISGRAAAAAPARLGNHLASFQAGKIHPIFFAPDVQLIPLRTLGLPPSTHTNAFLVGSGPVYLIDPGPKDEQEQSRLFELLDEHGAAGKHVTAIVLSHHHPDHIGAASACAARYGVPIWAHEWTAARLNGQVSVSRTIRDGEHLDLGPCPDGSGRWHLEAIHTPGHAPGHLAFYEPRYRLLFAGDMVSTLSSIVIVPPEGDLAVYLESLQRLRSYDCRLLFPAHGNASARPAETLDECLTHRAKREQQLLEALVPGRRTVAELGPELYKGLPEHLMRFAKLQIEAGLLKLQKEGRAVHESDDTWSAAPQAVSSP